LCVKISHLDRPQMLMIDANKLGRLLNLLSVLLEGHPLWLLKNIVKNK
jgi:hypothetical protein